MKTKTIAYAALLAAIAIVITVSGLSTLVRMPPPFSYLVFDFAEIPVLIAYMTYGLRMGVFVETIHFLFLMLRGEFIPLGPLMKYVAVISTIFGLHLSVKLKLNEYTRVVFASIFRALIMCFFNVIVMLTFFRDFLNKIGSSLIIGLGITLAVTFIYNVIHVLFFDYPLAQIILMRIRKYRRKYRS